MVYMLDKSILVIIAIAILVKWPFCFYISAASLYKNSRSKYFQNCILHKGPKTSISNVKSQCSEWILKLLHSTSSASSNISVFNVPNIWIGRARKLKWDKLKSAKTRWHEVEWGWNYTFKMFFCPKMKACGHKPLSAVTPSALFLMPAAAVGKGQFK